MPSWIQQHWRIGVLALVLLIVTIGALWLGRTWIVLALIGAFFLGCVIYRALYTSLRPAWPSSPSLTLCGPVSADFLVASTNANPGTVTITGCPVPIATGTTLVNANLAASSPPQVCLTGTLNDAGQLIAGTLQSIASTARTLTYRGPATAPPASNTFSLSGLRLPIASTASITGSGHLSPQLTSITLQGELTDSGQLAQATITRHTRIDSGRFFWLELAYLLILFAVALLYIYPDTPASATMNATLSGDAPVLLKAPTVLKTLQQFTLQPLASAGSTGSQEHRQPVGKGQEITLTPSRTSPLLVHSGGVIQLSPEGEIIVPKGTKGSFDQRAAIKFHSFLGTSNLASTPVQVVDTAVASLLKKNTTALLSVGRQRTSTPWDNFLLWMQDLRRWLKHVLPDPLGPIPLGIFWLGAVGSVIRGLSATIGSLDSPNVPWYYNTEYWHVGRPIIGAAFALFTYLFFLSILDPQGTGNVGGRYGTFLLAFVVGYSDGTFAALIERTINVLLGPGDPSGPGQTKTAGHS